MGKTKKGRNRRTIKRPPAYVWTFRMRPFYEPKLKRRR